MIGAAATGRRRAPVHVHVEHVEEDADAGRGSAPSSSSGGGTRPDDRLTTTPSAGLTTRPVARRDPRRIAEEIAHQAVASRPSQNRGAASQPSSSDTARNKVMNGQPALWMGGRTEPKVPASAMRAAAPSPGRRPCPAAPGVPRPARNSRGTSDRERSPVLRGRPRVPARAARPRRAAATPAPAAGRPLVPRTRSSRTIPRAPHPERRS